MRKTLTRRAIVLLILAIAAGMTAAGCKELEKYARGFPCGGSSGLECEDEMMRCEYEPGKCGQDIASMEGYCVDLDKICDGKYKPVCGCDGRTYGNDCMRLGERQRKAHDGPCVEK